MNLNDLLTNYKWDCGALKINGEDVALALVDKKVYVFKTFLKYFNMLNPKIQAYDQFMTIAHGDYSFRLSANDELFIVNSAHELCLPEYSWHILSLPEYLRVYKIIKSHWDLLEGTAMLYQKDIKKSNKSKVHIRRMVHGEPFDPIKVLGVLHLSKNIGTRENQLIERKNTYINKLLHNAMEGNIYLRYNQCIHAKFEFEERK